MGHIKIFLPTDVAHIVSTSKTRHRHKPSMHPSEKVRSDTAFPFLTPSQGRKGSHLPTILLQKRGREDILSKIIQEKSMFLQNECSSSLENHYICNEIISISLLTQDLGITKTANTTK